MKDIADFFAMGGYAVYVWPAYGVAAAIMIGLLADTLRSLRSRESAVRHLETAGGGRVRRRRPDARKTPASE